MTGDPLLWATSAALIIWVGFYLRVLRYRTVRPAQRAALMAGYFEHCTPDGNVPAIVGPDGRVSLRARRLFRVARVRPALFLYAAGSSRGASFNHGRRRSQRGDWTVITIRGGDLAADIGSRPLPTLAPRRRRHRSGRLPRTRHHHQWRRPGRLESRQQPHTSSDLDNRPRTAVDGISPVRTHPGPDRGYPSAEPLQPFLRPEAVPGRGSGVTVSRGDGAHGR